jgi:[phosphatase 2A protein]-leucine-carboxy methyltransferase
MGDDAVMATNDDATTCKRSAVQFGYLDDPYLSHMAKFTSRKAPEIHLGYFTRVRGLANLLLKSIEAMKQSEKEPVQIINLGAGFDTLYWRLKVSNHWFGGDTFREGRKSRSG